MGSQRHVERQTGYFLLDLDHARFPPRGAWCPCATSLSILPDVPDAVRGLVYRKQVKTFEPLLPLPAAWLSGLGGHTLLSLRYGASRHPQWWGPAIQSFAPGVCCVVLAVTSSVPGRRDVFIIPGGENGEPSSPDHAGLMPSSRIAPYRKYVWRQEAVNTRHHHSSLHPSCRACSLREATRYSVSRLGWCTSHTTGCTSMYIFPIDPGPFLSSPRAPPLVEAPFFDPSLPPQSQATSESSKPVRSGGSCLASPKGGSAAPSPLETCVRPISAARDDRSLTTGQSWHGLRLGPSC